MIKIKENTLKYYFYFVQERMNIFWNKYNSQSTPLTNDKILKVNKFTNVYRASDRVSQYLIRSVIYNDENSLSDEDILLRIIVFKIFNKIETWEHLEEKLGSIRVNSFDIPRINQILLERKNNYPIFNNAYMMTGTHSLYNHLNFKHEKWLEMVDIEMIKGGVFQKILKAKAFDNVYSLLRKCSFIGDFLAYQYSIDFNYSPVINFSEDSYVKAGIGAVRGIKKCFEPLGKNSFEDAIRYTHEHFEDLQIRFGYTQFKNLFGRVPTLIDLQNCFCETDKYLRAKMPELKIDNKRIKQKYKETPLELNLFFPPKWGINSKIKKPCLQRNTRVLTLF